MTQEPSFYKTPSSPSQKGVRAWLLTTDHKRIGIMYMAAILFWFFVGSLMGLLVRTSLMFRGGVILDAQNYNAAFTLHGVIMIFLFIIPGIPVIFGNFIMPIQI